MALTVYTSAGLTEKQFNFIRSLAADKNWSQAPTELSIAIKRITRATTYVEVAEIVKRKIATSVIDYLLAAGKSTVTTAAVTSSSSSTVQSPWVELANLLATLPVSKYAVWSDSLQHWTFVEVREQKSTKKRYLNKLLGAPGAWAWASGISTAWMISMAKTIAEDPTKFATNYCEQFTRCSACDSPLSNAKSIAEAMGPVCRKKFTWN